MPNCLNCNKFYSSKSNLNAHICKPSLLPKIQPIEKVKLKLVKKQFRANCGLEFATDKESKLHSDTCVECDNLNCIAVMNFCRSLAKAVFSVKACFRLLYQKY